MTRFLLIVILFSYSCLFGLPESDYSQLNSLINIEGVPPSLIGGCVNAISGDFIDYEIDLYIPGVEPLTIERNYYSSDFSEGSLCHGWNFNHYGYALEDVEGTHILVHSPMGSILNYQKKSRKHSKEVGLRIPDLIWEKGTTNAAHGKIGGKTNLNNHRGWFGKTKNHGARFIIQDGDKNFNEYETKDFSGKPFYLCGVEKSNGYKYTYHYHKSALEELTLHSPSGLKVSSLQFKQHGDQTSFKTLAGQNVVWNYTKIRNNGIEDNYFLNEVTRSSGPTIKYAHERYEAPWGRHVVRIKSKTLPEKRITKIEYYNKGSHKIPTDIVSISKRDDFRYGRVWKISKPIGKDCNLFPEFTFQYHCADYQDGRVHGFTKVFDALDNMTTYHYWDARLTKIDYHHENKSLYRSDCIHWGKGNGGYNRGYLVSKGVTDNKGNFLNLRHYIYDHEGNIIRDKIIGNISGKCQKVIQLDENGAPIANVVRSM
jgi:hypothetical protein